MTADDRPAIAGTNIDTAVIRYHAAAGERYGNPTVLALCDEVDRLRELVETYAMTTERRP